MMNPTFASFKSKMNPTSRMQSKQAPPSCQPKTFQELRNPPTAVDRLRPHRNAPIPLQPANQAINYISTKGHYPPFNQIKKSYSQINVAGGNSIPSENMKSKPDMPSKNFVALKKVGKQDKGQKIGRPIIVSPSVLKNRSFMNIIKDNSSKENCFNRQSPSTSIFSNTHYRLTEGDSYDSFENYSEEINRSLESSNEESEHSRFNISKLDCERFKLKDSTDSCNFGIEKDQETLNFSRKTSFKNCFEEKINQNEDRNTSYQTRELSSLSLIANSLCSSVESMSSVQSKKQRHSVSFHKKFQYHRRAKAQKINRNITLEQFQLIDQIGQGKYGKVYMAQHKMTGFLCALKTVSKAKIQEQNIEEPFIREIKIQMYLSHPNNVKLYGFFQDEENIYLIMECCVEGTLLKVMKEKKIFQEEEILDIISNVFEAVSFIHCHGIIHRDLKPENIVIQNGVYKICDFGWAAYAKGDSRSTFCGTPLYVCPQILKGEEYDSKADVWGLGILTYELAYGRVPFPIWNQGDMIKIVKDPVYFPSWTNVSEKMQSLIKSMLNKDPSRRMSLNEILTCSLLSQYMSPAPALKPELEHLF